MSPLGFLTLILVVGLAPLAIQRLASSGRTRRASPLPAGPAPDRPEPSVASPTRYELPPIEAELLPGWRPTLRESLPLEEIERLSGAVSAFPELPVGTRRIMSALHQPDAKPHDIARITASDPALATRILRVVNSSYYNLPHRISDLSHAIVLLGYNQVRNLVLQGGIGQSLVARDGSRIDLASFWYHSFCASTCAFHFARKVGTVRPGQAATVALLHDIGKPVLWWLEPASREDSADRLAPSTRATLMVEEARFGVTHATLGALLAARWGLPFEVVQGIEYHHHPGCTPAELVPEDTRALANILWMSDRFAHRFTAVKDGGEHAANPSREPLDKWDAAVFPALADPELDRELMRARVLLGAAEEEPAAV